MHAHGRWPGTRGNGTTRAARGSASEVMRALALCHEFWVYLLQCRRGGLSVAAPRGLVRRRRRTAVAGMRVPCLARPPQALLALLALLAIYLRACVCVCVFDRSWSRGSCVGCLSAAVERAS